VGSECGCINKVSLYLMLSLTVNLYKSFSNFSAVVHRYVGIICNTFSAGVGRTGTFITLDIVLKQMKNENVVDIHNVINKLRHQRPQMVQSLVRSQVISLCAQMLHILYIYR